MNVSGPSPALASAEAELARWGGELAFPRELERAYQDDFYRRTINVIRPMVALGVLLHGAFAAADFVTLPRSYAMAWRIRAVVELAFVAALMLSRTRHFRRVMPGITTALLVLMNAGVLAILAFARPDEPGFAFHAMGLSFGIIGAHVLGGRFSAATIAGWGTLAAYLGVAMIGHGMVASPGGLFTLGTTAFFLAAMNALGMGIGYFTERSQRRDFLRRRVIEAQREEAERLRAESERLLLNVLPAPVAERLKRGEPVADVFSSATVLFADIVGFTPLSAQLPPDRLVAMLNEAFSVFDRLAERYGLEKIKTIGDAYMVASGLPVARDDHVEALADMALDMLAAVAELRAAGLGEVHIRVGLHTGPVVAGVIGLKKFIYDLWGDTVNTASRMESHGEAGRIHVTAAVVERLGARYTFEPRGTITVKGKGEMPTFFLTGRITPSSGSPS